ncbi:methionine--tRNA ligase [Kutzneria sp. CA-103260]|uniref:methionine--tRNA ligase n=1 Tax=Kutzneria sp. CA-103260 TaxID=2802641 RepID=UPI001BADD522|nr:methionine--tRNA ligase [Kutzneria sp. CA-103260]QUQ68571.1 methionyl-tRNA synthetase [Kutzneria sp. CA-103260]
MGRTLVTTSIPYVNGSPHIGHALELVQADVLARHRRQRGDDVRAQTGTDDNALKNVRSAEAEGIAVADYVARMADRFVALSDALDLSFDDFVRTSVDPRHRPTVERLWRACERSGDLYRKSYTGLYCVGCEAFVDGDCPEHEEKPELVAEDNWFFRLSRYQDRLARLIADDVIEIEPATRKREVLAFVAAGLDDFSVSRSVSRARGWGIPVPDDPDQVIYVWFDALVNYVTGAGDWWQDSERVHVIGKGIIRFHAVYWPAMLLSAGLDLPSRVLVHEYLTANGRKIGKSLGNTADPVVTATQFGIDALRWWLLAEVARTGDTDYSDARLTARFDEDLANNIGNLVNRTVSMVAKYRDGVVPVGAQEDPAAAALRAARVAAPETIDTALRNFDFRRAVEAVVRIGDEANRYVQAVKPWQLDRNSAELDAVLAELVAACRDIAEHLTPFLPAAAGRILDQCGEDVLSTPSPVFPRTVRPRP